MSESQIQLETVVEELESKAGDYEEVENYEAKKQQYLSALSSVGCASPVAVSFDSPSPGSIVTTTEPTGTTSPASA